MSRVSELRTQRNGIVAQMKSILKQAETEKRDLTGDESAKFNELNAKADALSVDLGRHDRVRDLQAGDFLNVRDQGDATEVRALRSDETCADYLARRSDGGGPAIRFGTHVRAMARGARTDDERRALAAGSDSAGGHLVTDATLGGMIDLLRSRNACMIAGAQTVPLKSDANHMLKLASDPVATWRLENAGVAISAPAFARLSFAPKTLAVLVKASVELVEDGDNVEDILELAFARAFAGELDRVALLGASGAGEPVGLANMAGINVVSMGTNGAALTGYSKLLDAVYEVEADNATVSAIVANPRTTRTLNGLADSTGQPLRRPDSLSQVPFLATTGVPINQTQGTANNASTLFAGDFSKLFFGIRTAMRVQVLKDTFAGNLQIGYLAYLRADVQASHENAFAKLVGIIP